jgi:hypothetical protein
MAGRSVTDSGALHGAQRQRLRQRCAAAAAHVVEPALVREGRLVRMVGMKLEAEGCEGAVGSAVALSVLAPVSRRRSSASPMGAWC